MADNRTDDLNRTDLEAPGGTQATHAAEHTSAGRPRTARSSATGSARERVAERVDRVSESLEERARRLELEDGLRARAAPVVRRAGRAADAGAAYMRENDLADMRGDLEESIREHPLRSMAIALGAGYLLARLLD